MFLLHTHKFIELIYSYDFRLVFAMQNLHRERIGPFDAIGELDAHNLGAETAFLIVQTVG